MIDLGTLVDSYEKYNKEVYPWYHNSEYQLYDMKDCYPGLTYQPFLKMLNQTTGIWHMEAVSPECRTIEQALTERFNGRKLKIVNIK